MSADNPTNSSDLIVAAAYFTGKSKGTGAAKSSANGYVEGKLHFVIIHLRYLSEVGNLCNKICKVTNLNFFAFALFSCTIEDVIVNVDFAYIANDVDQRNFGVNARKLGNCIIVSIKHFACILLGKVSIENSGIEQLIDSSLSIKGCKLFIINDTELMCGNK